MKFQRETLFDVIEEVPPLFEAHHAEMTPHPFKLDPRWDQYAEVERQGSLVILTARDEGKLAGYSAYFTGKHRHFKDVTVAENDLLYLAEQHRKTAALGFLRYCEKTLKALGVQHVSYHCSLYNNLADILGRLGYTDVQMMRGKLI
jgi:hypothetical protein